MFIACLLCTSLLPTWGEATKCLKLALLASMVLWSLGPELKRLSCNGLLPVIITTIQGFMHKPVLRHWTGQVPSLPSTKQINKYPYSCSTTNSLYVAIRWLLICSALSPSSVTEAQKQCPPGLLSKQLFEHFKVLYKSSCVWLLLAVPWAMACF